MGLFFLFGLASLLGQALLLRETALVFTGHELSLAAALAAWLAWTAAGVRLGRGAGERRFTGAALSFALAAPLNLLALRLVPGALPALYQPGLFSMIAGPALLCAPAALANGYAAGAVLGARPAAFYAAEAAGAAAAGFFTLAYFRYFPSLGAALVLAIPALALAAAYCARRPFSRSRLAAAAGAALLLAAGVRTAPRLWTLQPPASRPAVVRQTQGSHIALAGHGDFAFYENGRLLYAPGDTAPEELVHIPLLALAKPGRVLLHGGGAFFALPEALKHGPEAAEIAEPDRFKAAAFMEFSGAPTGKFSLLPYDPRALRGRAGYYSAIFNAGGPPENAAANRFYTLEYFRKAAEMLAPGGVLVFQLPFAENYVPPAAAYAAACVLASARAVFPSVTLIPGPRLTVLASKKSVDLSPEPLAAAYARRGIKSRAIVPSALPFTLHPYRRAWAEAELAKVKDPPLNTDLNPLAYFKFWRAWLSMVVSPGALLGLAALALGGLLAAWRLSGLVSFSPGERTGEAFFTGFWALAFETAVLLAFQARTGRLSPELGALFALFMLGAAAGAAAAAGRPPKFAFFAEGAAAALALLAALAPGLAQEAWGARALLFSGGFVSGVFFSAAAGGSGRAVYAWDLAGGAAGGLLTAGFAAPLLGIKGALLVAGAAAAAALAGGLYAFYLRPSSSKESTVKE
ncbi:MAG: spermidine synthase family protein [Elusimicrobiales bacterium]